MGSFRQTYMSDWRREVYTFSAIAPSATDQAPTSHTSPNDELDVPYNTESIAVQLDLTNAANDSDDVDVEIEASIGGGTWTTVPYNDDLQKEDDATIRTVLVTPGVQKIRPRLNNDDATNSAYAVVSIVMRGDGR